MWLAASWWINLQILAHRATDAGLQGADAIAMFFLTGPRPGPRPMRNRDLLLAKALTLGLTAVLPFALTHWATVALRGFPLQAHALELTWNAALMVASCAVPVAALVSVSRNLQSVVLMLLAGLVVTFGPYLRYAPDHPWGQEATALWIVLAGAAGVLCWQYQSQRTTAGRIAIAAICLFAGSTAYWPRTVWHTLRRAASSVPPSGGESVLALGSGRPFWIPPYLTNDRDWRGRLGLNLQITGMAPGWEGRIGEFQIERLWSQDRPASEWEITNDGRVKSRFLDINQEKLINLDIAAEVELFGPRKLYTLPLNQSAHLPGAGWCRNSVGTMLRVECQCVLAPAGTLHANWGSAKLFEADRPTAPRWALPVVHPVQRFTGGLGGGGSYEARTIRIEARHPVAYVRRSLAIRDFLLVPDGR